MGGLRTDPAIERWAHLRENTHLYFKWNQRTTRRTLFWGIAVPVGLTILSYATDAPYTTHPSYTPLLVIPPPTHTHTLTLVSILYHHCCLEE
ncbi:hypothetical protein [Absidia glauca]|uniref:NADH-ubiquinone oxidoreductase B15 subunit n=1 Tax=Absidia glauca TaxID=4829 RepID=A0A163KH73_ABSGL|nr:hypothetical protein [Absidia glauca]